MGMRSGTVGLKLADDLPDGVRSLANILCQGIIDGTFTVFHRNARSGTAQSATATAGSARRACCTWTVCDCVDGSIHTYDGFCRCHAPSCGSRRIPRKAAARKAAAESSCCSRLRRPISGITTSRAA
ncbi:MAG: hypothetical protein ACLUEK_05630 [Oscillospiraceae bacterium]